MSTNAKQAGVTKPATRLTPEQTIEEMVAGLKEAERAKLAQAEKAIRQSDEDAAKSGALAYEAFARKVEACVEMSELLGNNYRTYAFQKLGFRKSQAHRLVQAGQFLRRASPRGDARALLTSEAHIRPLTGLESEEQDRVLAMLKTWHGWVPKAIITPKWVEAAVLCVSAPGIPKNVQTDQGKIVAKVMDVISGLRQSLPENDAKSLKRVFEQLEKKVQALAGPARKTGIEWTEATWNPLHGCSWASTGCDHCYAAKTVATRQASRYPGLARKNAKGCKRRLKSETGSRV